MTPLFGMSMYSEASGGGQLLHAALIPNLKRSYYAAVVIVIRYGSLPVHTGRHYEPLPACPLVVQVKGLCVRPRLLFSSTVTRIIFVISKVFPKKKSLSNLLEKATRRN